MLRVSRHVTETQLLLRREEVQTMLKISERTFTRLVALGVLTAAERGRGGHRALFDAADTFGAYLAYQLTLGRGGELKAPCPHCGQRQKSSEEIDL